MLLVGIRMTVNSGFNGATVRSVSKRKPHPVIQGSQEGWIFKTRIV